MIMSKESPVVFSFFILWSVCIIAGSLPTLVL